MLAATSIAAAPSADLRPTRERPTNIAKARVQDAQKQRLIERLRADAPSRPERPRSSPLDLPIFAERDGR